MILLKAAPMMTPLAGSTTLPLMANSLNSLNMAGRRIAMHRILESKTVPAGAIDYPAFIPTLIQCRRAFARLPFGRRLPSSARNCASSCCPTMRCERPRRRIRHSWGFLQSTYAAAADAGKWDRAALECTPGIPGVPRAIS